MGLNLRKLLEPMTGVPQVVGKTIHPPVVAGCPPAVSAAPPGGVTRRCRSLFRRPIAGLPKLQREASPTALRYPVH
jgi:hypothetical protein